VLTRLPSKQLDQAVEAFCNVFYPAALEHQTMSERRYLYVASLLGGWPYSG